MSRRKRRTEDEAEERRAQEQRTADNFARLAREVGEQGKWGLAASYYDSALTFQMAALDLALGGANPEPEALKGMLRRAAAYAVACGRHQRASHLLDHLGAMDLTPEEEAEAHALRDQAIAP